MAERYLSVTPLYIAEKEEEGRLGLTDEETKCRALLLYRTGMQIRRSGEITTEWLSYWNLQKQRGNPPHVEGIPRKPE
jgi:hypothetical protein